MKKTTVPLFFLMCCFFISCTATKNYSPSKKYSPQELRDDYLLLKNILEEKHPSLYWYTGKDSMDFYFSKYYYAISDSMTEQQFTWHILAPLVDKIHCGHTSAGMSKAYLRWANNRSFPSFPLFMKIWDDTMAVTANLNKHDSIFKRGTIIRSINGVPAKKIIEDMFSYLPEDGYANNINYIRISANFPFFHRNIYGLSKKYAVTYINSKGALTSDSIPLYVPVKDTLKRDSTVKREKPKIPKQKKPEQYRSLQIDSSGKYATMTLNTFSKGQLRRFFRLSFKKLKSQNISNLILDIRSNGGGRVDLSTVLARYITRKPFRVADTVYSRTKTLAPFTSYIKGKFINNIELFFVNHKKGDGTYHVRHLEKHFYKPKAGRYRGDVYVLTNGPTFSASTLFCNIVKGQPGIILAGEETGGGWYGNNGIMIPDIILPITKTRVRLPLFRVVQYQHADKKGSGIVPDLYIPTSYEALLKGYDKKLQVVRDIILRK